MTNTDTITASANGSEISFDGRAVTITRGGFTLQGRSQKTVPLRQITAVQFRPAGKWALTGGFLQLSLGGGDERQSRAGYQTFDALKDENSVAFSRKQNDQFQAVADAINAALREV